MTQTQVIALAYLLVSVAAFVWQLGSTLQMLLRRRSVHRRVFNHRGLFRTLLCRTVASALYIGVALITLLTNSFPIVGLTVFALTQLIWLVNSWLDLR